ncbi:acetyl-CoA carboxylase [Streptomyces sp. A3M-1-3]|uniref:carboxyl transferase domain-containing protein n=1 Tax=Streptomyces sp. A3M-1-3 TaxID=2962044 RepID=UPI0020B73F16|nr:carboxyl transferase domain-containing protein [Streptomyces sp. A3M-1-3]MCP3821225.1 acetyl-CoA carboxylase [Streptomyces sp. A3M-1-3]
MADGTTARQAIASVTDGFTELPVPLRPSKPDGPLAWEGYDASRARALQRTGERESVVCGTAAIGGSEAVAVSFEFRFLGGSLGERTGDRLEAAYAHAREHRLPLVSLVATGGSRMQEGMLALTQLQRVARQSALLRAAGLPQIAVLRDPTTGGGWATLGAGADVILALSGAQVGFAGSRVRPPGADPAAYSAEGQLAAGQVDAVVRPEELRGTLRNWLTLLTSGAAPEEPGVRPEPAPDQPGAVPPSGPVGAPPAQGRTPEGPAAPGHRRALPAAPPHALGSASLPRTGWDAVRQAREAGRPRAQAYLDAYFGLRLSVAGDRCGGTDAGMLCGFGLREGRSIAYAAQCGTATLPAGYRTAARLIRLADRLGIPVLTLVDTPGAANDAEAERAGAGAAIADVFAAVAAVRVPVTTLLIGEGGSGGALALAAPGNTWVTPDSYFSVIAPEAAAAILKRSPADAPATADQLRLRPQDLVELGVARGIVGPM